MEVADGGEGETDVTRTESFWLELFVRENGAFPILLQLVIEFASCFQTLFIAGFRRLVTSEDLRYRRCDPVSE